MDAKKLHRSEVADEYRIFVDFASFGPMSCPKLTQIVPTTLDPWPFIACIKVTTSNIDRVGKHSYCF